MTPSALLILGALAILIGLTVLLLPRRAHAPAPEPQSCAPGPTTQFLEVNGIRIRYHRRGAGPDLVLLHGMGASLDCWPPLVDLLQDRFTITALDLPGFGGSSKPAKALYGLDEQTDRLIAFFDALGIARSYIVGNSMGGNLALWLAHRNPERVQAVAVIAPAASPKLLPLPLERLLWTSPAVARLINRRLMRWAHLRTVTKAELIGDSRVEETFRTYGGNAEAVRAFIRSGAVIRDPRLGQVLGLLKVPVLILWGSRDRLVHRAVIDALESAIPRAESHVHVGGGHHLQEDAPDWVAEKLAAFFLAPPDSSANIGAAASRPSPGKPD